MKGISARAYLNLNVHLAVLCRNTIMPSKPPGQPPSAPNITRIDSDTRQPERCALHLSNPNTRKLAALNAANQMAADESGFFKRGLVLAFCFQIGVYFRWHKLAASPGIAPRPPVSETGALLVMQRGNGRPGRFCPLDFWV